MPAKPLSKCCSTSSSRFFGFHALQTSIDHLPRTQFTVSFSGALVSRTLAGKGIVQVQSQNTVNEAVLCTNSAPGHSYGRKFNTEPFQVLCQCRQDIQHLKCKVTLPFAHGRLQLTCFPHSQRHCSQTGIYSICVERIFWVHEHLQLHFQLSNCMQGVLVHLSLLSEDCKKCWERLS